MKNFATLVLIFCFLGSTIAQVTHTANDQVIPYDGYFRPGTNMGYNPPWNDVQLAHIAAGNPALGIDGVGAKAIRPALHGKFMENWGYDFRLETYDHYKSLGLEELTNIVGFPVWYQRDPNFYCPTEQSEMFDNLYTDIWDDGENGTPVNDENYFALYLWKTVSLYKDYIRFWEIWNEPGFDYTGAKGWLPPGVPGNWWDANPEPCDYKLRAPIFHYVRTLRIAWEVIKTTDPDAYVVVAGVGYPSFLDAILRNTDNPVDGTPTADYPHGGGAYFDVMGFHSYPHFDGSTREWDNDIFDFVYYRHSDAAADGVMGRQDEYQGVLSNYGYDGVTYPKKEWIITEMNLPRRSFSEFMGGEEEQINFIIKAVINSMKLGVRQIHIYSLGEEKTLAQANFEFDLMGLYKKLVGTNAYTQSVNGEGIAYKTASDQLFGTHYDANRTAAMELPAGVRGAAMVNDVGEYVYALWAETTTDQSEEADATYSFPAAFNFSEVFKKEWNHSQTGQISTIAAQNIELTARPIFVTASPQVMSPPVASFTSDSNGGCLQAQVQFTSLSVGGNLQYEWTFEGGTPATSNEANPVVSYDMPGKYDVRLRVTNALGTHERLLTEYIDISNEPVADFSANISGTTVYFTNLSQWADGQTWLFGDGTQTHDEDPTHVYSDPGTYTVMLLVYSGCGPDTMIRDITIIDDPLIDPPTAAFSASASNGCAPMEIQFTDQSDGAAQWEWEFPGAIPSSSEEQNPTVLYPISGNFTVSLTVTNSAGSNTFSQTSFITIDPLPTANFSYMVNGLSVSFFNNSLAGTDYSWDFGDGNSSDLANPFYNYNNSGVYTVTLIAQNACGADTIEQIIETQALPVVAFEADQQEGCAPLSVQFTDLSTGAAQWSWVFPGGDPSSSTEQHPTVVYNSAGLYPVSLTVSNSSGQAPLTINDFIEVKDVPDADFSYSVNGGTVFFINKTNGTVDRYEWEFGDGNASVDTDPEHTYFASGEYTVLLRAINECGENIHEVTLMIQITAIAELAFVESFSLYPNPNRGTFQLQLKGEPQQWLRMEIYDVLGRQLHSEWLDFSSGHTDQQVAAKGLVAGTYWLRLSSPAGEGSHRVVIY